MQSIHMAAGAIQLDAGEAFICAGVESMTRVPMGGFNPSPHPGLAKDFPAAYMSMGQTAENVARKYQLTRKEQEAFAVASHKKAAAAQASGKLAGEIVAIKAKDGTVDKDGCIRADTSEQALAALQPAFDQAGSVTAGTSSPLTDGASAVLVCTEEYAKRHKLEPLARLLDEALDGRGLGSQRLADGGVGEPVQLTQDERRALLGRQGVDVGSELSQVAADAGAGVAAPGGLRLPHRQGRPALEARGQTLRARDAMHRRRPRHRHHP